jgi:hypothetical protein
MQIELGMSKGQLIGLQFGQVNVAASQSNVQLTGAGVSGAADGYVVPFKGEILAVSYALSAAATAGTLTIGPTVNGTEAADPTLSVTTGTGGYDWANRGTLTFAAGDKIGAEITTGATWDATTADLTVVVWVVLDVEGV